MADAGKMLTSLMPHVNVVLCGKDDPQKLFGIEPERPRRIPLTMPKTCRNSCESDSISTAWA